MPDEPIPCIPENKGKQVKKEESSSTSDTTSESSSSSDSEDKIKLNFIIEQLSAIKDLCSSIITMGSKEKNKKKKEKTSSKSSNYSIKQNTSSNLSNQNITSTLKKPRTNNKSLKEAGKGGSTKPTFDTEAKENSKSRKPFSSKNTLRKSKNLVKKEKMRKFVKYLVDSSEQLENADTRKELENSHVIVDQPSEGSSTLSESYSNNRSCSSSSSDSIDSESEKPQTRKSQNINSQNTSKPLQPPLESHSSLPPQVTQSIPPTLTKEINKKPIKSVSPDTNLNPPGILLSIPHTSKLFPVGHPPQQSGKPSTMRVPARVRKILTVPVKPVNIDHPSLAKPRNITTQPKKTPTPPATLINSAKPPQSLEMKTNNLPVITSNQFIDIKPRELSKSNAIVTEVASGSKHHNHLPNVNYRKNPSNSVITVATSENRKRTLTSSGSPKKDFKVKNPSAWYSLALPTSDTNASTIYALKSVSCNTFQLLKSQAKEKDEKQRKIRRLQEESLERARKVQKEFAEHKRKLKEESLEQARKVQKEFEERKEAQRILIKNERKRQCMEAQEKRRKEAQASQINMSNLFHKDSMKEFEAMCSSSCNRVTYFYQEMMTINKIQKLK